MRKNRRGFTLIELLAVIVIMGVLSFYAIPTVTNLVSGSRDKMYINDTKKLISLAENKMKVSNADIDEPDKGKCIALSLLYLDANELDHAPNGGKYLAENSFVIIKNNNGSLEYSATLIEKLKDGGYKGIKLIKSNDLYSKGAKNYITSFKESELIKPSNLNATIINNNLGSGYVSGISKVYDEQDFSSSSYLG